MVGINGIGGIPEPKPDRPTSVRGRKSDDTAAAGKSKDGVSISSEAQAAATVARVVQESVGQEEIRAERVEAARQRLEEGNHKKPDVVLEVAKKLSKYLP